MSSAVKYAFKIASSVLPFHLENEAPSSPNASLHLWLAVALRHPDGPVSKKGTRCACRWVPKGRLGWTSFSKSFSWKAREGGEQQHRSQEVCPYTHHPAAVSAVAQRMQNTFLRKGVLISKRFPNLITEVPSRFFWQIRQPATRGRLPCTAASSTDPAVGFQIRNCIPFTSWVPGKDKLASPRLSVFVGLPTLVADFG